MRIDRNFSDGYFGKISTQTYTEKVNGYVQVNLTRTNYTLFPQFVWHVHKTQIKKVYKTE